MGGVCRCSGSTRRDGTDRWAAGWCSGRGRSIIEAWVERLSGDDLGMANGAATVLVNPGVEAVKVAGEDPFFGLDSFVELAGVSAAALEGVPMVEGLRGQLTGLQDGLDSGIGILLTFTQVFPDGSDEVAVSAEEEVFLEVQGVDVAHGATEQSRVRFLTLR